MNNISDSGIKNLAGKEQQSTGCIISIDFTQDEIDAIAYFLEEVFDGYDLDLDSDEEMDGYSKGALESGVDKLYEYASQREPEVTLLPVSMFPPSFVEWMFANGIARPASPPEHYSDKENY